MVDKKRCIGCGLCVAIAPDVFYLKKIDNQIIALPNEDYDRTKEKENIQDAIEGCPTVAIREEAKN